MKSPEIELPSNHKFGFFFSTIFLLASLYLYYIDSVIMAYVLGTLCGTFLVITIINAKILLPLNKLWMKFGVLLGMIISPIIIGIIFFGIFTPIAVIMRLSERDELRLRFRKQKTHWINRQTLNEIDSFKKQF
tara:strand:- start:16 stop:414 length:399 start_codon:yes stop_codon:yes gene_type:complete